MKEERLQSLFYSFIQSRESDSVDGIFHGSGNMSALYEEPHPRFTDTDYVVNQGNVQPSSPLEFMPFASLTPSQTEATISVGRQLAQIATIYSSAHPNHSNISFEKSLMIVEPKEQVISIPVVRSKNCLGTVTKVNWETCNKTAKSGIHFVACSGEIVFGEQESRKTIEIQILKFVDRAIDLRFKVKLDVNGVFTPTPITVTLKKIENLYQDEINVLNDLSQLSRLSVGDIACILKGSLTSRTFHVALSHLCSTQDAVPVQFALAFELGRLFLSKLRSDNVVPILVDFFREDEDIDFSGVAC